MAHNMSEGCRSLGVYSTSCVGPATEEEGKRISDYVSSHSELLGQDQPNQKAAEILGIPLIEKWKETFKNTVMTEGKNVALDAFLAGSAYTVTGPYMGLISSVGYSIIAATDVAAQIDGTNGWKEAGSGSNFPLYTTPRKTCVFSAASGGSKALSAALSFSIITIGGTVKGAFVVFGSGASSTIANTSGNLLSAGLFSGGDRAVLPGDTINVSWSLTL
jgi:hypothetical protein